MTKKRFTPPDIDYLSKDYASFQRLMREHLFTLLPDWEERNPADMGNALVELLAYVGDYVSYYQDAVATEAYLGTARRRVSVRRHARLLDYYLHEGCNARALIHIQVRESTQKSLVLPAGVQLVTEIPGSTVIDRNSSTYAQLVGYHPHFFETMFPAHLNAAHNELRFFVPDGEPETLPAGATSATLIGPDIDLKAGDLLIFAQIRNPETGEEATADPLQRHAVRLTSAANYQQDDVQVVDISWHASDALLFPMALKRYSEDPAKRDVAVAYGNIVLADYGRTVNKLLSQVQDGVRLTGRMLTYGERLAADDKRPIHDILNQDPRRAQPKVRLQQIGAPAWQPPSGIPLSIRGSDGGVLIFDEVQQRSFFVEQDVAYETIPWTVRQELLNSGSMARDYRVEIVDSRDARLQFGFDGMGWQPQKNDRFVAHYRVGSGSVGNVGAGAIRHIVLEDEMADLIKAVSNPLPAVGGQKRELIETVRLLAPASLQTQARCVTLADYESVALRHPDVVAAKAKRHWTGSWQTVAIHVRLRFGKGVNDALRTELQQFMKPYRLVDTTIQIREPESFPVNLRLRFTPVPHASITAVQQALATVFTGMPDGFFQRPFSMGEKVYRSQIVSHALTVAGVKTVEIAHFSPLPLQENTAQADEVIDVPETAVLYLKDLEIVHE